MPFKVDKLPDESILIIRFEGQANAESDYPMLFGQLAQLTAGLEAPIFRITDLTQVASISFGDLVEVMAQEYRSGAPGSAADPRIHILLVTASPLVKMGAQSVTQEQYGGREMPQVFMTMDEAIAHARAELKKK
jgi:hypothetical protein